MPVPLVFIDTSVAKLAVTDAVQARPRRETVTWGPSTFEVTLHQFVIRNQHARLKFAQRCDASFLPYLAFLASAGRITLAWHFESQWEYLGLPRTGGVGGAFFGAPVQRVAGPIRYGRVVADGAGIGHSPERLTLDFLRNVTHARYQALQKATGAHAESGRYLNQLLDAFHIWCAEHAGAYAFVTTDYKLIRCLEHHSPSPPTIPILTPRGLVASLFRERYLRLGDAVPCFAVFGRALARTYRPSTKQLPPLGA